MYYDRTTEQRRIKHAMAAPTLTQTFAQPYTTTRRIGLTTPPKPSIRELRLHAEKLKREEDEP